VKTAAIVPPFSCLRESPHPYLSIERFASAVLKAIASRLA
jgi:hypothetical protein